MLKNNIIFYRKKNGMSQEELANRLLVSRQTVSQWETGQTLPTVDNLVRLKEIFGVGFDALLAETAPDADAPAVSEAAPAESEAARGETDTAAESADPSAGTDRLSEQASYILNGEDLRVGLTNSRAGTLLFPALLLIPLIVSVKAKSVFLIVFFAVWAAAAAVFAVLRLRNKRRRVFEKLSGAECTVNVYEDRLTQLVRKDGETVAACRLPFNGIRRITDLGTVFRVIGGGETLLLPKRAIAPGGALETRLRERAKDRAGKPRKGIALILILGSLIGFFVVGSVYRAMIGRGPLEETLAAAQKASLIWLVALLFPVALTVYGFISGRRKKKRSVPLIALGLLTILIVCLNLFAPRLFVGLKSDVEGMRTELEEIAGIELPPYTNMHITSYPLSRSDTIRTEKVLTMGMNRSASLAFDEEIKKEPLKWISGRSASLSSVWNPLYAAETADFVLCVNRSTGQINALPSRDGTYRFVNVLYNRETETICAVYYEIDYRLNG